MRDSKPEMAIHYRKKAIELLREEGLHELIRTGVYFVGTSLISRRLRSMEPSNECDELPKLIKISPQKIEWKSTFSDHQFPATDSQAEQSPFRKPVVGVYGGYWDKCRIGWDVSERHKILVSRFKDGKDWDNIAYYKTKDESIRTDKLKQRWDELDNLYESIKEYGYIPQNELTKTPEKNKMLTESPSQNMIYGEKYPDEIYIAIGRNGEIIRLTGAEHRISMAKLLGIKKVPAVLLVRHEQWQELRSDVQNRGLSEEYEELYDHPDLQDILD